MENPTRTTSLCKSYTTCTTRTRYLPAAAYILHTGYLIKISFEIDETLFLKFYSAVHLSLSSVRLVHFERRKREISNVHRCN